MTIHEKINHAFEVLKIASNITAYSKKYVQIEVSNWGVYPIGTDSENSTMIRTSVYELALCTRN